MGAAAHKKRRKRRVECYQKYKIHPPVIGRLHHLVAVRSDLFP
jgi:hypothetical protein